MRFNISREKACKAIVMMAEGAEDPAIVQKLGISRPTVYRLRTNLHDWFLFQDRSHDREIRTLKNRVRKIRDRRTGGDRLDALLRDNRILRRQLSDLKKSSSAPHILPARVSKPTEHNPRHKFPAVRGECLRGGANEDRPCPWVRCRYHLAVVMVTRSRVALVDLPQDMDHTCALDLADEGSQTLDTIGGIIGLTRERVRQIEAEALEKIRSRFPELLAEMWLV